jgi:hypothetical protein
MDESPIAQPYISAPFVDHLDVEAPITADPERRQFAAFE